MKTLSSMSAGLFAVLILILGFNNCAQPPMSPADLEKTEAAGSNGAGLEVIAPVVDPTMKFASLAGLYSNGGNLQIVLPDGEYWTIGGYGIIQTRAGRITQASNGQFAGEITGGNGSRTPLSGAYSAGVSLAGANYLASSKTAASLNSVLGQFWGNSQDGDTPYLTFGTTGNITGYSANMNCQFSGKAVPHPSGLNVLKITLTRSNCLNNGRSDTYLGVARGYGDVVHVVGVTADKTRTFTYEGYFENPL